MNTSENPSKSAFNLLKYSRTVEDPSLKSYQELVQEIFHSERYRRFKEDLRLSYQAGKTNLAILGTGGTFQSAETDHGRAPTGSLQESFDSMHLPYNREDIFLSLFEIFNYDSSLLTTGEQIRFIATVLIDLLKDCPNEIDGFVVTHGTDTMVETANYLSFILGRGLKKPIILTGSQDPARRKHTDAVYHMDNCLKVHEYIREHGVAEVMVLCGDELVRGTWAQKQSDKNSNAFGSFNGRPLLGVKNRLVKEWQLSDDVLYADPMIPFMPFNEVLADADIPAIKLADLSSQKLAEEITTNRMLILTLLGSATCRNTHAEIIKAASEHGKPIVLRSPFHDSILKPGTYAAGSALKGSSIPQVRSTEECARAKMNFLWHKLGAVAKQRKGLGTVLDKKVQDELYRQMSQSMVGEWF